MSSSIHFPVFSFFFSVSLTDGQWRKGQTAKGGEAKDAGSAMAESETLLHASHATMHLVHRARRIDGTGGTAVVDGTTARNPRYRRAPPRIHVSHPPHLREGRSRAATIAEDGAAAESIEDIVVRLHASRFPYLREGRCPSCTVKNVSSLVALSSATASSRETGMFRVHQT